MTANKSVESQTEKVILEENLPTHSDDGVDLTLIRWMLSMTPAERLRTLQQNIWSILRLRGDQTET